MSRNRNNFLAAGLDDVRVRVPFAALTAAFLWLGILMMFGLLLNQRWPVIQAEPPVAVQLLDLGLAGGGGGSPLETSKRPPRPTAGTVAKEVRPSMTALPTPSLVPHRVPQHNFRMAKAPALVHQSLKQNQESPSSPPLALAKAEPSSPSSSESLKSGRALSGSNAGHGTGSGSGNGSAGAGSGAGGGFGTGGSGPRAIYAPVPSIPDDMRDEVMQATAVVRFHVSRDGSANVTMVTSTEFSELDELILATLQRWRFSPAVRDGVKIDADAEVRLLVSVQ